MIALPIAAAFALFIVQPHHEQRDCKLWRQQRSVAPQRAFVRSRREELPRPYKNCIDDVHPPLSATSSSSFSGGENDANASSKAVNGESLSSEKTEEAPPAESTKPDTSTTKRRGGGKKQIATAKPKPTSSAAAVIRPTKTARVSKIPKDRSLETRETINDDDATTDGLDSDENSSERSTPTVRGLTPQPLLDLSRRTHCTVTLLRKHIPSLLDLPSLSPSTAKWIYDSNVTVVGPRGDGDVLGDGIDEVLLLNRALATAATAARRAGSLFDFAGGVTGVLQCELILDPIDPLYVTAKWRTKLPTIGIGSSSPNTRNGDAYTEISGVSSMTLSSTSGLVTKLQINQVLINGVTIVGSLGTAIAAVRRAAKSASTIFDNANSGSSSGNALLDGIFSGIKDVVDAVDALPSANEGEDGSLKDCPLYVELRDYANSTANNNVTEDGEEVTYIPIDEYSHADQSNHPLVGSKNFVEYVMLHDALSSFARNGIYKLAGMQTHDVDATGVTSEQLRSYFATDVELITFGIDGQADAATSTTLLRGPGQVADFYRSLALLREASAGDWNVQSLSANMKDRRLSVCWKAGAPLQIEGKDDFIFEVPLLTLSSRHLPMVSDGDKDEIATLCSEYFDNPVNGGNNPLKISRIESQQLVVAGVTADSVWVQSFVSAALRSGITENSPLTPDSTIIDLLRSLTSKKKKSNAAKESPPTKDTITMPAMDDDAAISFYGILRALHKDVPNIVSADAPSTPAGDFLADTVELRGLLGEVVVRGSSNYRRLIGVAVSSLRAAIQTRTVRLAAKPRPTVEVTPSGSIRVKLILALFVNAPMPLGGGSDNVDSQGFGVPLKIEVSSEYVIDEKGKIREHRVLESRLNGVLTPGDVFSKWIKGLSMGDNNQNRKEEPSAMQSLADAVAWVRSMQNRK